MTKITRPLVLDQVGIVIPNFPKIPLTGPEMGLKIHWSTIAPTTREIRLGINSRVL